MKEHYEHVRNIVADSGYGSLKLINKISEWGGFATFSIATNECEKLDQVIGYNLELNNWRACAKNGIVFSGMKRQAENDSGSTIITKKFVGTSAFNYTTIKFGVNAIGENPSGN